MKHGIKGSPNTVKEPYQLNSRWRFVTRIWRTEGPCMHISVRTSGRSGQSQFLIWTSTPHKCRYGSYWVERRRQMAWRMASAGYVSAQRDYGRHTIINGGSPVHPAIDCYISACSTRLKWSYSSVTLHSSLHPRIFASHFHVLLFIHLEQQWSIW